MSNRERPMHKTLKTMTFWGKNFRIVCRSAQFSCALKAQRASQIITATVPPTSASVSTGSSKKEIKEPKKKRTEAPN
ncbi:hypothetical protein AXX17_AT2G05510 [Arabidopsis thaliana]|uniref:Uncharacterized protein n=1 Tax=Arabidopsis thaliana TaxID=3702 RepID=A0A178VVS0_ARATH|nr:hypothetical protein AXX17_AT2G05510 [Arabidopsis thaliana]